MRKNSQFAKISPCRSLHIIFEVKTDLGWACSFCDREWCVASVLGDCARGCQERLTFFQFFVMVRLQQSHRSLKQIIMHEPLTQWKWVWIPGTWLVVVSVLLLYSHLGCVTSVVDPMETLLWCHDSGWWHSACWLCHLRVLIGVTGKVKTVEEWKDIEAIAPGSKIPSCLCHYFQRSLRVSGVCYWIFSVGGYLT